jgi:hypothetical protein
MAPIRDMEIQDFVDTRLIHALLSRHA